MIKTGIYTIDQINQQTEYKNIFGMDKRVSITLYEQALSHPNSETLVERILLMFTDEQGAYKRTYANRFAEFDTKVLSLLPEMFGKSEKLIVQDLGVSDGRTAVDLFFQLSALFPQLTYYASDYNPKVSIIEKNNIKITLGKDQKVIEILWPPFVFNMARPDRYWHEPLNRLIQYFVYKLKVIPILEEYHSGKIQAKDLLLFCPAAMKVAKNDPRFALLQQDALETLKYQSHVVRAMNLLNPSYFSTSQFKIILKNIHKALHDNGIFITGSNQQSGSLVHGGIYRKTADGFTKLYKSGLGSSIADIIEELRCKSCDI